MGITTLTVSLKRLTWRIKNIFFRGNLKHQKNKNEAKQLITKLRHTAALYSSAYLFGMLRHSNPFVFEELLLLCFQERGFLIQRNRRYTGDQGIDGRILDHKGHLFLIQAKRYSRPIHSRHVYEFYEAIKKEKAKGGFFIHTGKTPLLCKNIRLEKSQHAIKLMSGQLLLDFILYPHQSLLKESQHV